MSGTTVCAGPSRDAFDAAVAALHALPRPLTAEQDRRLRDLGTFAIRQRALPTRCPRHGAFGCEPVPASGGPAAAPAALEAPAASAQVPGPRRSLDDAAHGARER